MNARVCIQSDLDSILANLPPYSFIDTAVRSKLSDTFFIRDYEPGEVLVHKGQPVDYVGFVHSGVFDIYCYDVLGLSHGLGSLRTKDYFGDLSAILNGAAFCSLACRVKGRCYLQKKEVFYSYLSRNRTLYTFFLQNALNKLWHIYQQVQPETRVLSVADWAPLEKPSIIEKALTYIEKNFRRPLTLEEMSSDVGLSRFHLSRTFKQYLGKSFKEYLTERRIAEAKLLMASEDKNVTEACFAVGFNDTSYFARVFRKREGISPSAYRKGLDSRRRTYPPRGNQGKAISF